MASCQLGFLTCPISLLYSVTTCMVGPRQPMAAIYKPTHEIKYYYYILCVDISVIKP